MRMLQASCLGVPVTSPSGKTMSGFRYGRYYNTLEAASTSGETGKEAQGLGEIHTESRVNLEPINKVTIRSDR